MKNKDKEIKELQIQIESLKADNEKLQKENEFWTNLLKNQLEVSTTAAEKLVELKRENEILKGENHE